MKAARRTPILQTTMIRPPVWTCPRCDQRDDPRFHECPALALDSQPRPAPLSDQLPHDLADDIIPSRSDAQ